MNGQDPMAIANVNANTPSLSSYTSSVANAAFTGNLSTVDQLRKRQQEIVASQKANAENAVNNYKGQIANDINSTTFQDATAAANEKYHIDENIKALSEIQQKIVDAQEAMDMGIAYELDRPARMQLLSGRAATLQRQGLATIGALQGTASVIKGNIELGKAFADQTIEALKADYEKSSKALNTLLELEQNNLVRLSKDEKELLDDRIKSIEKETARLDGNKDNLTNLMLKYPYAFQSAGVTMLDDYSTAVSKMVPFLSADEQKAFPIDPKNYNDLYTTGLTQDDVNYVQSFIMSNGLDAVLASDQLTQAQKDAIKASVNNNKAQTLDQQTQNLFGQQALNPDGTLKAGYEIKQNATTGKPFISKKSGGGGFWSTIGSWFGGGN